MSNLTLQLRNKRNQNCARHKGNNRTITTAKSVGDAEVTIGHQGKQNVGEINLTIT